MTTWIAAVSTFALVWLAQGPPPTEVFLAELTKQDGRLTVGKPENISNSPGYDNQPFFTPDGAALLFTSARGPVTSACGSPQTDIYRYDLKGRSVAQLTGTPECEYSPTVTPDGGLSVIRVEADGTQRLWRFNADGKNPSLVLTDIKPVGYHAWLDKTMLALFVLGPPATLRLADTTTGKSEVVATNIGQSILRTPNGGASFVQQAGTGAERTLTVMQLTVTNGKPVTKALTTAVAGATQAHLAWTPDGALLMAHDGGLLSWRSGAAKWERIAELNGIGL